VIDKLVAAGVTMAQPGFTPPTVGDGASAPGTRPPVSPRTTDGLRTDYGSTGPQLSWNSVTTPLLVKPVSWKVLWAVP